MLLQKCYGYSDACGSSIWIILLCFCVFSVSADTAGRWLWVCAYTWWSRGICSAERNTRLFIHWGCSLVGKICLQIIKFSCHYALVSPFLQSQVYFPTPLVHKIVVIPSKIWSFDFVLPVFSPSKHFVELIAGCCARCSRPRRYSCIYSSSRHFWSQWHVRTHAHTMTFALWGWCQCWECRNNSAGPYWDQCMKLVSFMHVRSLPELDMQVDAKREKITATCSSCGWWVWSNVFQSHSRTWATLVFVATGLSIWRVCFVARDCVFWVFFFFLLTWVQTSELDVSYISSFRHVIVEQECWTFCWPVMPSLGIQLIQQQRWDCYALIFVHISLTLLEGRADWY